MNAEVPESRSPVLRLAQAIRGAAFNVAPERADNLIPAAPLFKLALSDQRGFRISVTMQSHEATFSVGTLDYLWATAALLMQLDRTFSVAQHSGDEMVDLAADAKMRERLSLFNWARD